MATPTFQITLPTTFGTPSAAQATDDMGDSRTLAVVCALQGVGYLIETGPTNVGPWSAWVSNSGSLNKTYQVTFRYWRATRLDTKAPGQPPATTVTTLTLSCQPPVQGAAGTNGTNGTTILQASDTLVNGAQTVTFTGVTNGATARAWANHGEVNTSAALGILQCLPSDMGAGVVSVSVRALEPGTTNIESDDQSDIDVFLNDSP